MIKSWLFLKEKWTVQQVTKKVESCMWMVKYTK